LAGREDFTKEKLQALMKERGERVLPRFRDAAVSGISDPKFLEVLGFVCDYWKDNFRPSFASLCCEAVGGCSEAADDVSLMITLTSAGGGIHDDVLDKSSHKHFRMTVLGEYGLDFALLAGDLLIQKGWTMARNVIEKNSQPEKLAEVIEIFGGWTRDVCEAEFMEIQCRQNLDTEVKHYENVLCKSMADTIACARLGAIMGGGSQSEIQSLAKFASRLGFMYRLADDLKDSLNIEHNFSCRLQNESVPLPVLYAAKASEEKKSILKNIVVKSNIEKADLRKVWKTCFEAGAFDYVNKRAMETAKEALSELYPLRYSSSRAVLAFLISQSLSEISQLYTLATSSYQHGTPD
jgi:geranylgeranyl pyrophosphate synthase